MQAGVSPASVPPMPPVSDSSTAMRPASLAASCSVKPYTATGTPPGGGRRECVVVVAVVVVVVRVRVVMVCGRWRVGLGTVGRGGAQRQQQQRRTCLPELGGRHHTATTTTTATAASSSSSWRQQPTRYGLPQHKDVGLQAMGAGVAAGARADGVGLVDDQQRARAARQARRRRRKGRRSEAGAEAEAGAWCREKAAGEQALGRGQDARRGRVGAGPAEGGSPHRVQISRSAWW